MNVKQLKELLENVDDDVEVVVPGLDHSYYRVEGKLIVVEKSFGGDYFEYFYDEAMFPKSEKAKVLVFD